MRQLLQAFQESHVILALDHHAIVIDKKDDDKTYTAAVLSDEAATGVSSIQAVAVTQDRRNNNMIYAIAREDKTVQIFRNNTLAVSYSTLKRASSLCFAALFNSSMTVLLVADLAGDVMAYPVIEPTTDDSNKTTTGRLLLGHTASMLTRVAVHGPNILTADRDEKIRVSYFPETFRIRGYLLGHTAFVSSFDVYNEETCVSCGGDGTIRVWNLATLTELCCTETTTNDDDDDDNTHTRLIPTGVVWDATGRFVVVMYDQSLYINVFSWQDSLMTRCARMTCQAQPLGLVRLGDSFLILIRESPFLQEFQSSQVDWTDSTDTKATSSSSVQVIQPASSSTIPRSLTQLTQELEITDMPESLLERDPFGNIKIEKHNETRGPNAIKPWENVSRIEVAKERNRRFKRRKRELMSNDNGGDKNDDDDQHDDDDAQDESAADDACDSPTDG